MSNYIISQIAPQPGIQRDKTKYSAASCTDGKWVRFYEGVPSKILGYKTLDYGSTQIVRSMLNVPVTGGNMMVMGRRNSVSSFVVDPSGNVTNFRSLTPALFPDEADTLWSFSVFNNQISDGGFEKREYIIAVPTQKALNVALSVPENIYTARVDSMDILTPLPASPIDPTPVKSSGGVVAAPPLLVALGQNGTISWTFPGEINNWHFEASGLGPQNSANIANSELVVGFPTPGADNPVILAWSLNQVVRTQWIPGQNPDGTTNAGTWISQVLQNSTTILSANCVIPYNQMFFWISSDQFYFYNGVVNRLPNSMNSNFFFDYLDYGSKSKVWGCVNAKYNEIWWFWPKKDTPNTPNGTVTECNHVIKYSLELKAWDDTPLDRSAGVPSSGYQHPVWASSALESVPQGGGHSQSYPVWTHERGLNKNIGLDPNDVGDQIFPIESYFETNYIDNFSADPQNNRSMRAARIELDLVQSGDMTLTVNTRAYPRTTPEVIGPYTFDENTDKIDDVYTQGRIISFVFRSNVVNGYYQMGKVNLDYKLGAVVP